MLSKEDRSSFSIAVFGFMDRLSARIPVGKKNRATPRTNKAILGKMLVLIIKDHFIFKNFVKVL
jgi:hypothetical protein